MSLETAVVRSVSLNNSNSNSKHSVQQDQPRKNSSTGTRYSYRTAPSSGQQQALERYEQHPIKNSDASSRSSNSGSNKKSAHRHGQAASRSSTAGSAFAPSPCHWLVEQIIHTVGELEHTLIEDHQNEFELRMALERQTERVHDLRSSLATEKQRNERLVELIRGVDSSSSTDEDDHQLADGRASCIHDGRWQLRTSMDAFESISPLLMQQRYDELALSHKQCRKQLIQKEKLLTRTKCEKEEAEARYDHLLDEYRNFQRKFEQLCCKYLRLQAKKNLEIIKQREALSCASDCVIIAQKVMEEGATDDSCSEEFRQNLELFIKALRLCEWAQHKPTRLH